VFPDEYKRALGELNVSRRVKEVRHG